MYTCLSRGLLPREHSKKMIHLEPWYRESVGMGFDEVCSRAWARFDHTEGTGPEAIKALMKLLHLSRRVGRGGGRLKRAMLEVLQGRLDDALPGDQFWTRIDQLRTFGPQVGLILYRTSASPDERPLPLFYFIAEPGWVEIEGALPSYTVHYRAPQVHQDDPFPEDIVNLDQLVSTTVSYLLKPEPKDDNID